jgi:glycosyltransferase involved in cell wall biosynthesis
MIRRIAYCSPVNPVHSGISDYSEELLPYLGQYFDITLYVDPGLTPANPLLTRHLTVRPITQLSSDHAQQAYDAILYHMGNSPSHRHIWDAAQRTPGVIVLHDLVLHHFMVQYHAVHQHNQAGYIDLARQYYGEAGERVAQRMLRGVFDESVFDMPLCQPVIETAQLVIGHSHYVADAVRALRPTLTSVAVPMGVPILDEADNHVIRQHLGLGEDAFILASFGHVNPYKRVDHVLRAIRTLRQAGVNAHYIIVGSVSEAVSLPNLVRRTNTAGAVHVTGYVSAAQFNAYVAAADICINLRHPTAGETSASLLRLLAAAKPTLISASGSFLEIPTAAAVHIPIGAGERDMLSHSAYLLYRHPELRAALARNAREFTITQHTLPHSAAAYAQTLAQHFGWDTPPIQRPPLWDVTPPPLVDPSTLRPTPVRTPMAHSSAGYRHQTTHDIIPGAQARLTGLAAELRANG